MNNPWFSKIAVWMVIAMVLFTVFKQFDTRGTAGNGADSKRSPVPSNTRTPRGVNRRSPRSPLTITGPKCWQASGVCTGAG